MAVVRVIAHFMHESEAASAQDLLEDAEFTEGYALGSIDASQLSQLRDAGLIVGVLDGGTDPGVDVEGLPQPAAAAAGPQVAGAPEPGFFVVQLAGPITPARRESLQDLDVRLLECVAPSRSLYSTYLTPQQLENVRGLGFVAAVRPYDPNDQAPAAASARAQAPAIGVDRMLTLDLRLHRAEDADTVESWLASEGVSVAGVRGRKIRIYLLESSPLLTRIRARQEVQAVEEFIAPSLHNDRARALMGIDPEPGGEPVLTQTGDGELVAVADTGVDRAHPDLVSRIERVDALGRTGDASDPDGHGTHVCGSVAGDGSASNGGIRGTAPGAKLYVQSIMDADGELGGLPWNLADLFQPPYDAGARIHNNSWGAATASRYTFNSIEADEFVHEHRDMLLVISAGNEGVDRGGPNTGSGFVDWLSIGSPASSKNALTVGASRSDRSSGGYSGLRNNDAWPADFPHAPEGDDRVSGDPEEIAAFSSRGPCDDRRIKPDLVAPGTDIVSTRSSTAPSRNFWGSFPGSNRRYAYNGGTSMSAPLVAGCAALVREYYRKQREHESPSAALVKATLVNSTRWLSGRSATAEFSVSPNFHQGFGCLHMQHAIPNDAEPWMRLAFLDPWEDTNLHFATPGQRMRFDIDVADGGEFLRLCLAWTDLPARALQNNLNLFVEEAATGRKWVGNQDLPLSLGIPDPENNVEVVRIPNPTAGTYRVQVTATNLLGEFAQDFALVATGALDSELVPA
ncbi:MAG: S8 family serine peptidase [bacterium]|nr:S8 family serine peptidase [bacterium]